MNSMKRSSKPRPTKGVLYFRNVSAYTKSQFKSTVYRRGDNMNDVVQALMDLYVKDPSVVKVPKRRK